MTATLDVSREKAVQGVRIGPSGNPPLTLGWQILGWTADYLQQPDGPTAGEPWMFTPEQARFVLWWYAIDERGRFRYRTGVLRRLKGWGKDPLAAALCGVEMVGPCRFGGFNAAGEPFAIPHPAAWIQTAAVSKEQTRNTMTLFPGMFSARAIDEFTIDLGKEIIYAHHGRCRIEAVTSSPRALEGGRGTFIVENETQHWLAPNEGHAMAEVIARNAGKSRDGSSRVLAITNAHRIGEDSVAERDWEAYQETGAEGDILYDSLEAPEDTRIDDLDSLRAGLIAARGDSEWLDVDRLAKEIQDPRTPEPLGRRFYLNQLRAERSSWISAKDWEAAERAEEVPKGTVITLGFDGSRFRDATALVGTVVETGYQWILGVWERPDLAESTWEVPTEEVKLAVRQAFTLYDVWRMNCDPYWWEETIATWAGEFGAEKVIFWHTNRLLGRLARLIKSYETAVRTLELGHERSDVFARHIRNAVKRTLGLRDEDGEPLYLIQKEGKNSLEKIDVDMAALLSWEARTLAVAAGAGKKKASVYEGRGVKVLGPAGVLEIALDNEEEEDW